MAEFKFSARKTTATKQGVRGTFTKTVYKPLVNGRVVGNLVGSSREQALDLAKGYATKHLGYEG